MAEQCGDPLSCEDVERGAASIDLGAYVRLPDGPDGEFRTARRVSVVCGSGGGGGNYDPPVPISDVDGLQAALDSKSGLSDLSILYAFDADVSGSDPTSGTFKFNNATFGSISTIRISKVSGGAQDLTAYWSHLIASGLSGYLTFKQVGVNGGLMVFRVNGISNGGSIITLAVAPIAGSAPSDGSQNYLQIDATVVPSKLERTYTQAGHGFSQFQLLRVSGDDTHGKAKANAEGTSVVDLMVSEVIDANTFKAVQPGSILTGLSGLTAGPYFLSGTTAGAMETTDTATVSAPVGVALNATTFLFDPKRPSTGGLDGGVLPTGNTIWVDQVNGNDSTGIRGDQAHPFQTLSAAKDEAVYGDLIFVRPGEYDEKNLLKDGVNWHFEAGANVIYTGASNGSIFDDGPNGSNGPITCIIDGSGIFRWTNDFDSASQHFAVVHIQNQDSNVVIRGCRIDQLGNNFQYGWTVLQEDGMLKVSMSDMISSPGGAYNLGWFGGTGWINALSITGKGVAITWIGSSVGGNFYVTSSLIETTDSDFLISTETEDTIGALWVESLVIKGNASSGLIHGVSGKVYITSQKVWNTNSSGPVINCQGFILWMTAQKITSHSGFIFVCEGASGTVNLDVQQYESMLIGPTPGSYASIYNEGADLIIHGGIITISNPGNVQRGLDHVAGTTRALGLVIRSSGNDQTNSYPVNISSSGLILDHCTLISPSGCDSINASSSQSVTSLGSYTNTDVGINVTVQGDLNVGTYVS